MYTSHIIVTVMIVTKILELLWLCIIII